MGFRVSSRSTHPIPRKPAVDSRFATWTRILALGGFSPDPPEGARLSREVGDLYYLERMLMNLGLVAMATGDLPESKRRLIEGLRIAKQNDNWLGQSSFLRLLGGRAVTSGQARLAARLLGAAEALGSTAGATSDRWARAPLEGRPRGDELSPNASVRLQPRDDLIGVGRWAVLACSCPGSCLQPSAQPN